MSKRQQGFTLIEVLVALVILALTFSGVLVTSMQASDNLYYLREKNTAHQIALKAITMAQVTLASGQKLTVTKGTENIQDQSYNWKINVKSLGNGVQALTVNVQNQSDANQFEEAHAYVYVPA